MSNVTAVPIPPVKRGYILWLVAGVLLALVAATALAMQGDDFLTRNARAPGVVTTASGLQYKVLTPGSGGKPTDSDVALILYEGRLTNGTVFDKSPQPVPMPVAGVVPGFSEGLKLMSKGAKYRLWIKPSLGYGAEAKGDIPANSTLEFDVELLDFLPEAVIRQMQQQQMMGGAPGGGGALPPGALPPGAVLPGAR